jgi:hypothetical protein
MRDASWEQIEAQLAGMQPSAAPQELRAAVMDDVRRELRAGRRDRRLARIAGALLLVGLGMNIAVGLKLGDEQRQPSQVAEIRLRESLVDTAVVVAEATDARTGSRYARQLAAMIGHTLSDAEAAAIDAAVDFAPEVNGSKG